MEVINVHDVMPLEDKVLIKKPDRVQMTDGGLYKPDNVNDTEPVEEGLVMSSGPGRWLDGKFVENPVSSGSKVLYHKYSGLPLTIGGEDYLLLGGADVLALLKDAGKS